MNYIIKKDLLKCYRDDILVPEQDGKQWTQHERDRLVTLYDDGWGISEMALDLQRTENGIVNQLICMNRLIPPRSRRKRSPRKKKPQVQRLSLQLPKRILSKGETLCLKTAMIS